MIDDDLNFEYALSRAVDIMTDAEANSWTCEFGADTDGRRYVKVCFRSDTIMKTYDVTPETRGTVRAMVARLNASTPIDKRKLGFQ